MPPPSRITIRLAPPLAARLAATVGPRGTLADIVRHAIEAYLDSDIPDGIPTADTADRLAALADTVAAMQTHLEGIEQRLTALEAVTAAGRRRQPPSVPPQPATYNPTTAFARIQALRAQGLSLAQIATQLNAEGIPTRRGRPWLDGTIGWFLRHYG